MAQTRHTADDDHWFEPTTVDRFEAQKLWEMRGTRMAVQRYRDLVAGSALVDTIPGRTILKDVVPGLTTLVADAQREGQQRIANSTGGRPSPWWWYLPLLPADVIAVIACTTALGMDGVRGGITTYTTVIMEIARRMQLQVEFGSWAADEKEAETLAKEADLPYRNLHAALKWEAKAIDARAVRSWWRKIKKLRDEPWERNDRVHLGDKVAMMLAVAGAQWFDIQNVRQPGGKTARRLTLTPLAQASINDIHTRAETAFSSSPPMICRPLPWRRVVPTSADQEMTA